MEIAKQNNSIELMNASLCILPDSEGFKCDSKQEKNLNKIFEKSENFNDSDFTSEVSTFPCPFCLNSCNPYDDGIVHVKSVNKLNLITTLT